MEDIPVVIFKDTMELENAWQQNPPWKIWAD
jgi:hypothetical protein